LSFTRQTFSPLPALGAAVAATVLTLDCCASASPLAPTQRANPMTIAAIVAITPCCMEDLLLSPKDRAVCGYLCRLRRPAA
jgi:hypothetical protein